MLLRKAFPVLLAAALPAAVWAQSQKPTRIGADELKQWLDSKKKLLFLDVREAGELQQLGTVKGYLHIPIGQLESRLKEVPRNRSVVVACDRGVRSARGAEILHSKGYKSVRFCGLVEWRQKNYPLVYPKSP